MRTSLLSVKVQLANTVSTYELWKNKLMVS